MQFDQRHLIQVAQGKLMPDQVITNALVLNVYTGELLNNCQIGILGDRIAYLDQDTNPPDAVPMIDAENGVVIPGFIDGHTHLDALVSLAEQVKYIAPGGTTTVVTETSAIANAAGYSGVEWFLNSITDLPITVYALAPPMVPGNHRFQAGYSLSLEQQSKLWDHHLVVGIGEVYWPLVLECDDRLLGTIEAARQHKLPIQGHSAGLKGRKLAAFFAAGISSCHEPITAAEALERLRLGLHVLIREGSVRRELEAMVPLAKSKLDLRRLCLCTDGVEPHDLVDGKSLSYVVQKAINLGFDPVKAIQMATINVAEHLHLEREVGGIAPGLRADLLILPEIDTIKPRWVIARGKVVARQGKLCVPVPQTQFTEASSKTFANAGPVEPSFFNLPAPPNCKTVTVRTVHQLTDIITTEELHSLPVQSGYVIAQPEQDILKVAIISNQDHQRRVNGFITGFGLRSGACASSYTWDVPATVVVGTNANDMAVAVNRIRQLQGGIVVCDHGQILAELPLPVAGIISSDPLPTAAEHIRKMTEVLIGLGYPLGNPLLALQVLTFTPLPALRLSDLGLVNVIQKTQVPVIVDN